VAWIGVLQRRSKRNVGEFCSAWLLFAVCELLWLCVKVEVTEQNAVVSAIPCQCSLPVLLKIAVVRLRLVAMCCDVVLVYGHQFGAFLPCVLRSVLNMDLNLPNFTFASFDVSVHVYRW